MSSRFITLVLMAGVALALCSSETFAQNTIPQSFVFPTVSLPGIAKVAQAPASVPNYSLPEPQSTLPSLQVKKVTIKQLQEIALQNHPGYQIAENQVEAERGTRLQAGLKPNPTLRIEGEEIGAEGSAGKQGVSIEQQFGGAARRNLLVQQSDRAIEALGWNKQITISKIRNDVRALAYQVLIAQKKVEFQRQLASISQAAEDNAQAAILAGSVEITQLNFIQMQNQTRQAKLALTQRLNEKESLEKKLAILLGVPGEPIGEITDDPEALCNYQTLDESSSLDSLLEYSPEIAKKRAEIAQKQASLAYERAPQKEFSLGGGVTYDFSDSTTLAQVGIGLPLRINDRNQGNIQRATAEYFAAQKELERLQLKLRADLAELFAVYKSALAEVQTYKKEIIPDIEKLFSMSQQAYQQGQINFLEISVARTSYVEASVNYLEALERLANSVVKIEGQLLDQSLENAE